VAEVNVTTGAFDVRYGNALSGVVDIRLKEGTEKTQFGITTSTGSYGGRAWQVVTSGNDPIWTPILKTIGFKVPGTMTSIIDLSGSLFETRFSYLGTSDLSVDRETLIPPFLHPRLISSYEDQILGYKFKYPDSFGPSQDNRWAGRYGLTWKPDNMNKVSFNFSKRIAIDQGFSRTFLTAQGDLGDPAYPWRWDHKHRNASTFFEDNVQSSVEWRARCRSRATRRCSCPATTSRSARTWPASTGASTSSPTTARRSRSATRAATTTSTTPATTTSGPTGARTAGACKVR
jgi:hypothetical protein